MSTAIELIDEETLGVSFPYDADLVAKIKTLQTRRWNPRVQRWEVHLSHLADLMRILSLSPRDVGEPIIERFRAAGWARCKLKVVLGLLEGKLSGSGAPVEALDLATSYFIPGYKFSPKFIAKKWDGKRHLLDRRKMTFPAGLWPRIRRIIEENKIEFELDGGAKPRLRKSGALEAGPPRIELRPYQIEALEAALQQPHGIVQMATGGGKTLLAAHLIRRVGERTFFFVHTLDLLYQTAEVFANELGIEIGILGDGQANLRPVTVATIQTAMRAFEETPVRRRTAVTAATRKVENENENGNENGDGDEAARHERRLELDEASWQQVREAIESAGVVIFDECHHVPADSFYKIAMRTTGARWRWGLSATPWRDDHHDLLLEAALGEKIHVTCCSDLVDRGFLIPPHIQMAQAPPPPRLPRGVRYHDCYQLAIVENRERNCAIAARARDWAAEGRSVLILVAQVTHGRALLELLPEARLAYGALESGVRQEFLKDLEQKLHPILVATTLADEGLDVPSLDALILAGGGKSATRAYQRIGRVLRPAPGKREALVLDFLDAVPYLREHSEARLKLYRQEPRFRIEILRKPPCKSAS